MDIFFDCFGTLVDTEQSSLRATRMMLAELDSDIEPVGFYKQWKAMNGHCCYEAFQTEHDIFLANFNRLMAFYGSNARAKSIALLRQQIEGRTPFDDAISSVKQLSAFANIYVASNSDHQPLVHCLAPFLPYLSGVYSSEEFRVYKPDVEFFRKMLAVNGSSSSESVYIGDSLVNDVMAPSSVGINSYLIDRGAEAKGFVFSSLAEVTEHLSSERSGR